MKAMILAAGMGTRLRPFTDSTPKPLAPVNGQTVLERNIRYLAKYDIHDVIVNVHHLADQIVDLLREHNGFGSRITISDEREFLLETGGGLKKAAHFFDDDEPFVVMNSDILTDFPLDQLIKKHLASNSLATLATSNRETSRFLLFTPNERLAGWENTKTGAARHVVDSPAYDRRAFSGVQVLSPKIFDYMPPQEKFSIIEVYMAAAPKEEIGFFDHSGFRFIDVGKPETLARAQELFVDLA